MKITHIILENFAGIYAGMHKTKLEIDFKNNKNKIIILNAENGKGKTTLMSLLHPLRETFDARKDIVIKGELGHKVVDLIHNSNKYHIEHFYGKKNKSFISKNGTELNENGNIKSFNEIAENELGINDDYFKIGRIGSNVSNFIDFKSSERKKYITEFIPSIDGYLEAYDVIKERFTESKSKINYIKKTIEQYSGLQELEDIKNDVEVLSKSYNSFKNRLIKIESKIISLKDSKDKYEKDIMSYINENTDFTITDFSELDNITEKIDNLVEEYENNYYSIQNKLNTFITRYKIKETDDIYNYIKSLENKFLIRKTRAEETINKINNEIDSLNSNKIEFLNKIDYFKDKLEESKEFNFTEDELENINENLKSTKAEIKKSKTELNKLLKLFDNEILNELYDYYENKPFNNCVDIINEYDTIKSNYSDATLKGFYQYKKNQKVIYTDWNKGNINSLSEKENRLDEVNKQIHEIEGRLSYVDETLPKRSNICNDDKCSFIKSALEIQKKDQPIYENLTKEQEILESEIDYLSKLCEKISTYIEIEKELNNVNKLLNNSIAPYFSNIILQNDLLITNNTTLLKDINFIDFEKILNLNNTINNLNEYQEKLETKLNNYKMSEKLIDEYNNSITVLNTSLQSLKETLNKDEIELQEAKNSLNDSNKRIAICNEFYSINDDYSKNKEFYDFYLDIQKKLFNYIDAYNKFKTNNKIDGLLKEQDLLKNSIPEIENKLKDKNTSITIIENNLKDLSILEDTFRNIVLIKDALDPKKGIPVVFANEYLKSIATKANELLSIAYDNHFKIKFEITASDFLIEVYKSDGTKLNDINEASQGETSLTNLSLSLAMLENMIKKYNILYLDEVDCTLSTENRKLFIDMLEKQIDDLDIEQCFVITHNNEFYDKNIDLILLEGHDCDLNDKDFMNGKNIIFKL